LNNIIDTVLKNRGIDNINEYLSLTDKVLYSYKLFKNIDKAVQCFNKHTDNNSNIHIVVDSDVDGYTSGAIMYSYINDLFPNCRLSYSLHTKKQHGLSNDIEIPKDIELLIIPDAGSNDIEECKKLKENNSNLDIIILDHHIIEQDNPYAIVVNSNDGVYPNKELSGVGVVYKFLQALDDVNLEDKADSYLDLVALGNIADMMDIRVYETKRLIDKGLIHKNIKNKVFRAFIEQQRDTIHNNVSIHNIQFYIVPLINAMIRMGRQEEKELMFKSFIEQDEYFDYKKRGSNEIVKEDIYTRVARFCSNTKTRQQTTVTKVMCEIEPLIDKSTDKVLFVNASKILADTLTGVLATKIAEKYQKPTLCLRKTKTKGLYGGSGRNYKNSFIKSLKDILTNTNCFEMVQGHDNAFGLEIASNNIKNAINTLNNLNIDSGNTCKFCDFIIQSDDLTIETMKRLSDVSDYCGQNIDEPLIAIENIELSREQLKIMGKLGNSWKFETDSSVNIVKFNVDLKTDEVLNSFDDFSDYGTLLINAVGKANINYYQGIATCQFIIDDYEVVNKW
jgi:single-stranded-DNA-specific exonuclease